MKEVSLEYEVIFVMDGATNMVKAFEANKKKKKLNRLTCIRHLINTVLRNSFDDKKLLAECEEILVLLQETKDVVAHFQHLGNFNELDYSLKQHVDNRWNTNYDIWFLFRSSTLKCELLHLKRMKTQKVRQFANARATRSAG